MAQFRVVADMQLRHRLALVGPVGTIVIQTWFVLHRAASQNKPRNTSASIWLVLPRCCTVHTRISLFVGENDLNSESNINECFC